MMITLVFETDLKMYIEITRYLLGVNYIFRKDHQNI